MPPGQHVTERIEQLPGDLHLKVTECVRLLILGYHLYISEELFFQTGPRWFPELEKRIDLAERVRAMQRHFWHAALGVGAFFLVVVLAQSFLGLLAVPEEGYVLRAVGAYLALVATLGRGGWAIQTWAGNTVVERIDRGMFVVSQLGATAILLFVLAL